LAAAGAVSVIGLIVFFGFGLASSQSKARREVVARFSDHAAISAALTSSLVETAATGAQASDRAIYGSPRVADATLSAAARRESSPDVVLLTSRGSVIASSSNTPSSVLRLLQLEPAFIRMAVTNRGFAVSNVTFLSGGGQLIQLAQAFSTPYGERLVVKGVPLQVFSGFMNGFLADGALHTEAAGSSRGFIVDGRGVTMATSNRSSERLEDGLISAALRHRAGPSGHGRFFVSSRIGHSPWLVVLTAPGDKLFASVSGATKWVPWILFIAFGVVSVLALVLILRSAATQRAARTEAERANQAKSEFLSRMSHELRTPLNSVIGFAQLLELDELEREQRDGVEQILKAGRHLLELINEVLDISRIEAGTLSMSLEPVHLGSVLAEALSLISPLASEAGVSLIANPADLGEVHVRADHQRVKQVVINVLSNAVKYNRRGGEISVRSTDAADGRVELAIADTGKGLSAEQLKRMFEPFDRLDETEIEGTGLGLALSMRLMEAMGGTIKAESQPGEGTTMRLELDRARGPYEEIEPSVRHAPTDSSPQWKIVYIEDNLSNLKLVERLVERAPGVRLIPAMQASVGIELARRHQPDLVLLDLHLPDLNGREALARLMSDPATAGIPVVILSADATPSQVERLKLAGATDYVTKPIDLELLLKIILRTIESTPQPPDSRVALGSPAE
jgi:signal transduction histidine kinase/CheY-like chemotaxis protein